MKQTTFTLLLTMLLSMVGFHAYAYSIIDGIYYDFNEKTKTAKVTFEGSHYSYNNEYTGAVVIPSEVTFGGFKYSVTSIGDDAFRDCSGLTSVTIPNSVTSIGDDAFRDCSGLTSVTIPNSVTSIGSSAFSGCSGLTSIVVESGNTRYDSRDNCNAIIGTASSILIQGCKTTTIPNSVTRIGGDAFSGCSGLTSITIPNSVTSIDDSAFYGCSGLTTVTIPNSVTSIGRYAFYGCSGLTSVTIPNSVTSISESAFSGCSGLTTVTIPNSVTSIGEKAFRGCTGLTSITIPNSVTSIGSSAFYGCSGLTSIVVESGNTTYDSRENCNAIIKTSSNTLVYGCKNTVIPNSVTSIGSSAFYGCSGLTTVTIPNSVTRIGDDAFRDCSGLTSIVVESGNTTYDSRENSNAIIETASNTLLYGCKNTVIPNSVTSIGEAAFRDCSGLTSVTIGNSVTSIGSYAFYGCSGLTSITIPNSVTSIGDNAFYGTAWYNNQPDGLVYAGLNVYAYKGTMPTNTSITIEQGTVSIGYGAFEGYYELTSITIPNSVTSIGDYAFSWCSGLTFVTIPNSVTSIGDGAFLGCDGLTSVIIGNSVTSIGDGAFSGCSDLTSVTVLNPNPVTIDEYAFSNRENATLYVRKGSKYAYQAAIYWQEFKMIEEISLPTHKLIYMVDGEVYKSYDVEEGESIIPETAPTKEGYTFSGWSEVPETMPAHDVVVTGTFSVNSYTLTYKVDGEVYKTATIAYGTTITPEANPTKEGYTFSGWSEIPATMPAHDVTVTGTFAINKYKLTYIVDGVEYKSYDVEYGAIITPEEEPTKEGYTFSRWSEIPATMPAHDVTVTGTFTINKYKLTYIVDGVEYKSYDVEYGATITPEEEPTKEGYTFSGWSEIPTTMPAHDVTVTGTFTQETGIEQIMGSENGKTMIFTIDGKRVDNPKKGVNVIRMKDGTTRKVVVK